MTELPKLKEELDRKVLETYQWVIEQAGSGQMTEPEVKVAMQTVFSVTAGLIDGDIQAAAETVEANKFARTTLRRVFQSDLRSYVVSWEVGTSLVQVTGFGPTAPKKTQAYERGDPRLALQIFSHLCEQMTTRGLEEVL